MGMGDCYVLKPRMVTQWFNLMKRRNKLQNRLNSIIDPGRNNELGTTTHWNKNINGR